MIRATNNFKVNNLPFWRLGTQANSKKKQLP